MNIKFHKKLNEFLCHEKSYAKIITLIKDIKDGRTSVADDMRNCYKNIQDIITEQSKVLSLITIDNNVFDMIQTSKISKDYLSTLKLVFYLKESLLDMYFNL